MKSQDAKQPTQARSLKSLKQKLKLKFNPRVFFTILSATIILTGSYLAIQYAKGNYRLTQQGLLPESGLLSANSFPPGAQVFIDGKLATATDDTLYLEPGKYQIKIIKDGYSPWQKNLIIKKELVTQTNAQLFPSAPTLTPLTSTGAQNLHPSPDGRKILYYTNNASTASKNGLYVLELTDNLIPLQKTAKHLAEDVPALNLSQADFIWSPDSSQIMLLTPQKQVLLELNSLNKIIELPDVSFKQKQILSEWEEDMYLRERQYLVEFPEPMIKIATSSAKNVYISPDKKRLLYTATASAQLENNLVPPVPSRSTQPENRQVEPGKIYVYDREEDKNFEVGLEVGDKNLAAKQLLANDLAATQPKTLTASPGAFTKLQQLSLEAETASQAGLLAYRFNTYHTSLFINTLQWFADSKHLMYAQDGRIQIMEYDGTNNTTLYSGPFAENFLYPWPDGSKLVILTSFSPDSPKNLYAIELH